MIIEELAVILRDAAKAEIIPRFRQLDAGTVRAKSSAFDLVTEADEAAERAITSAIRRAAPNTVVIGEEATAANPALLERRLETETVVYVDPVDGTFNFAAGLALFAVMAAVVRRGETVAGVIYDPVGDDWTMAERGSGSWQIFPDGRRIRQRFAAPAPLQEMGGLASVSFLQPGPRAAVLTNLAKVRMLSNYRCAGHEYRMAASGYHHFMMYNKLLPWDHLAGSLIVAEAGAYVARFDGSAYRPGHVDGGLLVAPDRDSWDMLRREVFTV